MSASRVNDTSAELDVTRPSEGTAVHISCGDSADRFHVAVSRPSVPAGVPVNPWNVLITGAGLLVGIAVLLGICAAFDRDLFLRALGVMTASVVGGRIPAILTGLELQLGAHTTAFLMMLINTAWLFIAFPLFVVFSQRVSRGKILSRFVASTADRASTQRQRIDRIGTWALPVFIWLPFPLTGAVVGAVIGLLMGMPHRRLMYLVVPSMWVGIFTWSVGFEHLIALTGHTGKIICWSVTGVILLYSLIARARQLA